MAQEPSTTSGQGYPHDTTGPQQPTGYEYQQPWYPQQQEAPADPWNGGYQQPYAGTEQAQQPQQAWQQPGQWDTTGQIPQQHESQPGYPAADPYGYQPGYPDPATTGYQQTASYQQTAGYQQSAYQQSGYGQTGDYGQTADYGQSADYAQGTQTQYPQTGGYPTDQGYQAGSSPYGQPYDPSTPLDQLYAPVEAQQTYHGYLPPQPMSEPTPAGGQPEPAAEPTSTAAALAADEADQADQADGSDWSDEDPEHAEWAGRARRARRLGRTREDSGEDSGTRGSIVDRAKAAAGAVISADHAPSRRALLLRVGAGVAALAVLVTAGLLATSDDKPTDKASGDTGSTQNIAVAHDKAWTAQPAQAPAAGTDDTLTGTWLLADAVVRADASGVHAYALADGKPTWTLDAPAAGAVACGLSPTVNAGGLGAVVFRSSADPKSPCTTVAAVDTKTGKATWTKNLADAKDNYAAHVAVTDDKVIAVGDDKAAAWAAGDGKDLWQYAGQGKFCTLSGGASGKTVLLYSSCADSSPVDQAVALNADDGKVKWWRGLNNQPKTVTVLSAEPAVVLTTGAQPADDRVFAWGAEGDPAAEIPVTVEGGGRLDAARGIFDAAPGVFFHDRTMLVTVTADGGAVTAVTAYDLNTGKAQWKTAVAEKGKSRAVGVDGGGLLLAVDERVDQPAHISRFALDGGPETQGGAFQKGTGSQLTSGRLLSTGGKVISVPEHSSNFGTATAFSSKG